MAVLIIRLMPECAQAQGAENGIYVTREDLIGRKILPLAEQARIHQQLQHVLVIGPDHSTRRYKYGTLAGYRQDGTDYRAYRKRLFFHRAGYYKILHQDGLIFYSRKTTSYKTTYTWFYYSTSLESPVHPLNIRNLKRDFTNPKFLASIDTLTNEALRKQCDEKTYTIAELYRAAYNHHEK